MKNTLKAIIPVLAAGLLWAGSAIAADKVTIGVSIPAATHGWTGGLNFHAKEAKKRLETADIVDKLVRKSVLGVRFY